MKPMQGSAKTCYIKQGLRVRCCTSHDKPRLGMIASLKGGTTPGRTGDAHRQATRHIDTMNGCLGHRGVEEHVLHNHNTGTFPARCWRMLLQAHYCKVYEPMALSCRQANKTHGKNCWPCQNPIAFCCYVQWAPAVGLVDRPRST